MHNSQLIAKDKAGFGHDGVKESKVSETITSVSKVETSKSKTSNDKMPKNETVRQAENLRKNNKSPRGNKRNWNNMMTQKLGDNFKLFLYSWYQSGLLLISRNEDFVRGGHRSTVYIVGIVVEGPVQIVCVVKIVLLAFKSVTLYSALLGKRGSIFNKKLALDFTGNIECCEDLYKSHHEKMRFCSP
ncbi:hypothetical protein Tco_0667168 [Tanacetum coccineum]